ncbi:lipoprotein [Streptomyces sp. NBC_00102]|uniref:lipoprotein n=1 Tax=Streptomyces sp. NBC_00102 TaxID=2975652 RepID=UPI00224FF404|nr:lipoprotein [Streptomyces sp. NBC_00102]MCX5399061.1 lipoprotein [Streptomyces sp. NBC_00102]
MTGRTARRGVPAVRAAVAVTAALCALSGCGTEHGDKASAASVPPSRTAAATQPAPAQPAAKGGSIGGAGSACELPVTFDLAADWKPEAVDVATDSELAELARQGPMTMACEIDAKPAGNIGFLRVWRGEKSSASPRDLLKAFVEAETGASGVTYTDIEAGKTAGAEAVYTVTVEALDETKQERAFLVPTAKGPVVVHLGGLDTEEHEQMLPAYELAKSSLRTG